MKTMKKTKISTRATTKVTAFVLAFTFFVTGASVFYADSRFREVPGRPFYRQCTRGCSLVRGVSMDIYLWCEETDELTNVEGVAEMVEKWNNCKDAASPSQAITGGPPRPAITFPENVPPDSVRVVPTFTPIVQEPPVPPRGVWRAPLAGEPLDYSIWYGVIRSAIVMPQRELTNAELQIWVDEYWELGGKTPFEFEVVRYINKYRATYGLAPFRICPGLSMAARYHSHQMRDQGIYQCPRNPARSQGFLAHVNPVTGTGSNDRSAMFGSNLIVTENAFSGVGIPESPVEVWINSSGHRSTLLFLPSSTSPELEHVYVGVGVVPGGGTTLKVGWAIRN